MSIGCWIYSLFYACTISLAFLVSVSWSGFIYKFATQSAENKSKNIKHNKRIILLAYLKLKETYWLCGTYIHCSKCRRIHNCMSLFKITHLSDSILWNWTLCLWTQPFWASETFCSSNSRTCCRRFLPSIPFILFLSLPPSMSFSLALSFSPSIMYRTQSQQVE